MSLQCGMRCRAERRSALAERRYEEGDPLIREALDRGKVLYERHR
jgi:hypothetical protein